jgi:hypothetical protein
VCSGHLGCVCGGGGGGGLLASYAGGTAHAMWAGFAPRIGTGSTTHLGVALFVWSVVWLSQELSCSDCASYFAVYSQISCWVRLLVHMSLPYAQLLCTGYCFSTGAHHGHRSLPHCPASPTLPSRSGPSLSTVKQALSSHASMLGTCLRAMPSKPDWCTSQTYTGQRSWVTIHNRTGASLQAFVCYRSCLLLQANRCLAWPPWPNDRSRY